MTISTEGRSLGNFMTIRPSPCGMNQAKTQVKLETFTKILLAKFTLQIAFPFHCNCTEHSESVGISACKNMKKSPLHHFLSLILVPLPLFLHWNFIFFIVWIYRNHGTWISPSCPASRNIED